LRFFTQFLENVSHVDRTADNERVSEGNVRVALGRFDRAMAKKLMDIPYVCAVFQKARHKGMAQTFSGPVQHSDAETCGDASIQRGGFLAVAPWRFF
jgi:hypothetical protein